MIKWRSNLHCSENGFGYEGIMLPSGSFSQGFANIYNTKKAQRARLSQSTIKILNAYCPVSIGYFDTLYNLENISIYCSLKRQICFCCFSSCRRNINWYRYLYSNYGSAVWIYAYVGINRDLDNINSFTHILSTPLNARNYVSAEQSAHG